MGETTGSEGIGREVKEGEELAEGGNCRVVHWFWG